MTKSERPTAREWMSEHLNDYANPSDLKSACAKALNVNLENVARVYRKMVASRPQQSGKVCTSRGIASAAFLAGLNLADKLSAAIKQHCVDAFILDSDMRALADIPANQWRRVAERPEMEQHQIKISGKLYWSSVKNVNEARKLQEEYR